MKHGAVMGNITSHEEQRLLTLRSFAGVAQLVEHLLAKEDVASSSLVTRSNTIQAF